MASGKLLVPSDITLLEDKYTTGRRRLTCFEALGLQGILPMWHGKRYTKLDRHDMRRVLSRQYPSLDKKTEVTSDSSSGTSHNEILEILHLRQQSIRKRVLSQNFMWAGAASGGLLTAYSFRHYDLKSKCIILPFVTYGMGWIGRWTGDLLTGRWSEYGRNRFLGELPSKQYFVPRENNA